MDRIPQETQTTLANLITKMDSNVGIERVDYDNETVVLNYTYNKGTKDEWVNHDFLKVNTAMESVPCAIWEVVNAVFRKCVA